MAGPGEIRVQDEQGNVHVFPGEATPEMIARAMGVKPPKAPAPGTLTGHVAEMRSARGSMPAGSDATQYARGYQGEGDAARDSGPWIERAETEGGRALSDPRNFLPSWHALLGPPGMAYDGLRQAVDEWDKFQHPERPREDTAKVAGDLLPSVLSAAVTHAGDAVPNMGDAAGSEFVHEGLAHPLEGAGRAVRSIQRPDLLQIVKDPLGSLWRAGKTVPDAVSAGLGDEIRIQPKPRSAPAWQTAPQPGTLLDSVLSDRPTTGTWNDRPAPPAPRPARPARPAPAWKTNPQPGTEVPSILNQQPYAQAARPSLLDEVSAAPPREAPPNIRDIPDEEWDEGSSIDTGIENTPREGYDVNEIPQDEWNLAPYMETGVEGTPRGDLTNTVLESLRQIEAAKAAKGKQ